MNTQSSKIIRVPSFAIPGMLICLAVASFGAWADESGVDGGSVTVDDTIAGTGWDTLAFVDVAIPADSAGSTWYCAVTGTLSLGIAADEQPRWA